jgi:hypothetical protein
MLTTRVAVLVALCLSTAGPATAQDFQAVRDKDAFLDLVGGRELRLPLFRIRITLSPDGSISGSALGWPLKGQWKWEDGYFCRDIDWSGTEIPFNCQLVEARGADEVRFTVDQGKGDSASFRLRPARGGAEIEAASAGEG